MKYKQQSLGKTRAIALYESEWWKGKSDRDIAEFQFLTAELCLPFGEFHRALEATLGRPVWTHELGLNCDGIGDELFNGKPAPSLQEIMNLIPESKRIVLVTNNELEP